MRPFIFFAACLCCTGGLFAQKPVIDTGAIEAWPSVGFPAISRDGRFTGYWIRNRPAGSNTLIVQSTTDPSLERAFPGVSSNFDWKACLFSADNTTAIFRTRDTLWFMELATGRTSHVSPIGSLKWPTLAPDGWLAYTTGGSKKNLVVRNGLTGEERSFSNVTDFLFDKKGSVLLLQTVLPGDSPASTALDYIELPQMKATRIWTSQGLAGKAPMLSGYIFDDTGERLAFICREKDGPSIWYFARGMPKAEVRVSSSMPGMEPGLTVSGFPAFSRNGQWLFFDVQLPPDSRKPDPHAASVDIWSYKDPILQPEQIQYPDRSLPGVVNTDGEPAVRVFPPKVKIAVEPFQVTGDYIVLYDNFVFRMNSGLVPEWWPWSPQPSCWLVSLKDGSRKLLKREDYCLDDFSFSPDGKWLVYYDWKQRRYFSCEVSSGQIRDVSGLISHSLVDLYGRDRRPFAVSPVAGWYDNDDFLLYDNYDIWRIDPSMRRPPAEITHDYGTRNHVQLRLVREMPRNQYEGDWTLTNRDTLLLVGLNDQNKRNGFLLQAPGKITDPKVLTMGPYTFYHTQTQASNHYYEYDRGMPPLKAADVNRWIVTRQSAVEAPDFYVTDDFIKFAKLSRLQPQAGYNWLTAELLNWKQLDGEPDQGILYKPEDFDPARKYPVIFFYYQRLSHQLYEFPIPELTTGDMNIPWFVSRGYLVFTPDIDIQASLRHGKPIGECTYNAVVSAVEYLSRQKYVSKDRMGIQGHSFGGYETNYLITHTHLFTAAAEAAGMSDPISRYLTLTTFASYNTDHPLEWFSVMPGLENGPGGFGGSPWELPGVYLDHSAVVRANRVSTPLLMFHNKLDDQVQWRQGVELYMALWRLGKPVWMLQYDGEGHVLRQRRDALDYTIRLNQFFDYYLKGAPAPVWMTEGIPARLKGIETGYRLDKSGKQP